MVQQVTMFKCDKCGRLHDNVNVAMKCCSEPKPLGNPPVNRLQTWAINYIRSVRNGKPVKDAEQRCFEQTLEVYYGPSIFEWLNQQAGMRGE